MKFFYRITFQALIFLFLFLPALFAAENDDKVYEQLNVFGEAFDKIGKVLGLKFPGGPELEKIALRGNEDAFAFPKPLVDRVPSNLDLSFSGLKSHIINFVNNGSKKLLPTTLVEDIAASFQKTISEILIDKLEKAIRHCNKNLPNYSSVVISGGVASNQYLRKKFVDM